MKTVLILAANPSSTSHLRLDQEIRDIEGGLRSSPNRNAFKLIQKWAVRPRDIQRAMLEENPQIIHFSGHGVGEEGLVFEDEVGNIKLVAGNALAGLFQLFADHIECVLLNGCYSKVQAEVIVQYIDYVIAMNQAIPDKMAIAFAVAFYKALGSGHDYESAFDRACETIQSVEGATGSGMDRKAIPIDPVSDFEGDSLIPILLKRASLT